VKNPHIGSTLDQLLQETGEVKEVQSLANHKISITQAHVSDLDVEQGRRSIEGKIERLERDSGSSRLGLLRGALMALADFGSVHGVVDTEEAFLEAARAAWKAK
jgi:hypothetical protein